MWRSGQILNVLLLLLLLLCSLSVVTSQHKARKFFGLLQEERDLAQQVGVEWGQLQLEQSTLSASARVEKIALRQLKMELPKNGQIQFVQIVSSNELTVK